MTHYELLCVLPGTLSESEASEQINSIQSHLTENGAEEIQREEKGKSRLAYPMRNIRYGYFYVFAFDAEAPAIAAMQTKISLLGNTLRSIFQIVNPERKKELKAKLSKVRSSMEMTQMASKEEISEKALEPEVARQEEPAPKKQLTIDIDKQLDEILDASIANI